MVSCMVDGIVMIKMEIYIVHQFVMKVPVKKPLTNHEIFYYY